MNFRINMAHQEVLDYCEKLNYTDILLQDEFRVSQQKTGKEKNETELELYNFYLGDPYGDFKEADITFPPTYKFDLRYENTYAKHRTPSYTVKKIYSLIERKYFEFKDRILYRDKVMSPIECTQYQSVEGVKHSDHKPVVAHFRVKLKPGLHT